MARRNSWKPCPTTQINAGLLKRFHWSEGGRFSHLAALMCWTIIVHEADADGAAQVTYDKIQEATGLGRTAISKGLKVLIDFGVITRGVKRGQFHLSHCPRQVDDEGEQLVESYNNPWGKLPLKRLYSGDRVRMFYAMTRRQKAELDALKLFFLIAAKRDRKTNTAHMTYKQIADWAGIPKGRIGPAITILAANQVVLVSEQASTQNDYGISNGYRLVGVDSYLHRGTALRSSL